MKAYVLINASPGRALEVAKKMEGVSGISAADAITGEYDVIAVCEAPDVNSIGSLIVDKRQPRRHGGHLLLEAPDRRRPRQLAPGVRVVVVARFAEHVDGVDAGPEGAAARRHRLGRERPEVGDVVGQRRNLRREADRARR
ncbi:MAG: Lrp/AsnC family transcriptional regulator [Chloroflexi bacterium]|nr:MAG: Lrp/AsnC family transcriptional regulator [Chloroflexota bacterium]